jgi:enamine deaminase RidA (YjgF/YER057c/UK114 family)
METTERMSKIVIHNNTIYLCGQVADNGDAPIALQTKNMLAKVEKLLGQAGSGKKHILSATIYLRDMKDFAGMNAIWDKWIPEGHAPARACVEARLARPDLLVEVSIIATQDAKPTTATDEA